MATKITYNNEELANFSGSTKVVKCKDNVMDYDLLVEDVAEVYDGTVEDYVTSETWVINESPDVSFLGPNTIEINFISNNVNYSSITATNLPGPVVVYNGGLLYDSTEAIALFEWTNQAYRTVTFLEPPTGELLTFLQSEAVKQ